MDEPSYIVAVAYEYEPPSIIVIDGWNAWWEWCWQVKRERPVSVRQVGRTLTAGWHPRSGETRYP